MKSLTAREGFTLVEAMIVLVIIGILSAIAIPKFESFMARAREATVKENCHTVRLAAEDFAVQNLGVYAASTADATAGGVTFQSLLPQGALLENPFTSAASEPINGAAAAPGQTGYQPIVRNGSNVGYMIDGFGRTAQIISMSSG